MLRNRLLSTASALVFLSTAIFFNGDALAVGPFDEVADTLTEPSPNLRAFTSQVERDLLGPVLAGLLSSGTINGGRQTVSDFSETPYADTTALHPRARLKLSEFTPSSTTGAVPSRADLTTLSATLKVPAHSSGDYELTFTLPGLTATSTFPLTFKDLSDRANGVIGACVRELKAGFELKGDFNVSVPKPVKDALTLASQERDSAKATLLARDSDLATARSQLQSAQAQALQLQQDFAKKEAELVALQSSSTSGIAAKDLEISTAKSQLQAAEAQVLQLQKDFAQKEAELLALQSTSTSGIAAKDLEISTAKSQLQAAEAQVLQLQKDFAQKEAELLALQSSSTSGIAAKDLEISTAKSQLQAAEAQVLQLQKDFAQKEAELLALQSSSASDVASRDSELATARSQLQTAQAQLYDLQRTSGAQQEEIFSLKALQGQLEEARLAIATHADVTGTLEAQAQTLRQELSELQLKLGMQEEEMYSLRALQGQLEEARSTIAMHADVTGSLEAQLQSLRAELAAAREAKPAAAQATAVEGAATAEQYKAAIVELLHARTLEYSALPDAIKASIPW